MKAWYKHWKKERFLKSGGWVKNGTGKWESPRKDDFKLYTFKEALEEENFYWDCT